MIAKVDANFAICRTLSSAHRVRNTNHHHHLPPPLLQIPVSPLDCLVESILLTISLLNIDCRVLWQLRHCLIIQVDPITALLVRTFTFAKSSSCGIGHRSFGFWILKCLPGGGVVRVGRYG